MIPRKQKKNHTFLHRGKPGSCWFKSSWHGLLTILGLLHYINKPTLSGGLLRLVFTIDGVGVLVSGVIRALMTWWKPNIGVISATESESAESERFHFFQLCLWLFLLFRLWSRENQIVGVWSRSGRTKPITKCGKVHCDWFVLLLLLSTPTIWFSLDHKWNVSNWVVSGIGTLFSLDHKLYASDYDSNSDSLTIENQPIRFFLTGELWGGPLPTTHTCTWSYVCLKPS